MLPSLLATGLFALALSTPSFAVETGVLGLYRHPALAAGQIVFVAEGDLWVVPEAGGSAARLTRTDGEESFPVLSPDGRLVAFSAEAAGGGVDIFVMSVVGGVPRRLTWHPAADEAVAFAADGASVYYRSSRDQPLGWDRIWQVPVAGGPSAPLPLGRAAHFALAPDGHTVAFSPYAADSLHCKRYLGGLAPDLWITDLRGGAARRLTTWEGTDARPMWHGDRLVFLSDRSGLMDLWSVRADGTDLRQHTHFDDADARFASLSGHTVVFTLGADLWRFDLETETLAPIPIRLRTDRPWAQARMADAASFRGGYDLISAERVVVEARGALASFPVGGQGRRIDLGGGGAVRLRSPVSSPDGQRIAAWSDAAGEEGLVIFPSDGSGPPVPVPNTQGGWHFPVAWAPKGDALAWSDATDTLWVLDLSVPSPVKIDQDPLLEIDQYRWSPDGRLLAYVRTAGNGNGTIWIFDRATGTRTLVSDPDFHTWAPAWDPQGRWLVMASQRDFDPLISGDDSSPGYAAGADADMPEFAAYWGGIGGVYLALLQPGLASPALPPDPLLNPGTVTPDAPATKATKKVEKKAENPFLGRPPPSNGLPRWTGPGLDLDLAGLPRRTVELPLPHGEIGGIEALADQILVLDLDPLRLSAVSMDDVDRKGTLRAFRLDERDDVVVARGVHEFRASPLGTQVLLRTDDGLSVLTLEELLTLEEDPPDGDEATRRAVSLDGWRIPLDPAAEWAAIFEGAWRIERDFFWDRAMVGVDWKGVHDRYAAALPRVGSRVDLNDLIGQMVGELTNVHHHVSGGDRVEPAAAAVGLLGADLVPDPAGGYRIEHLVPGRAWSRAFSSPLAAPQVGAREGDRIFAIDGVALRPDQDPLALLVDKADRSISLTLGPDSAHRRTVLVEPQSSDDGARYLEWVDRQRARVQQRTAGRVGYLHLRDMMGDGLADFARLWFAQHDREGLIIDVRGNGGGYISQLVIQRITRTLTDLTRSRNQSTDRNPFRAFFGSFVFLCDEGTASDGEGFTQAVRTLGLGPIIGARTWGGLVGYRVGKGPVDGGFLSAPEFGAYGLTSGWIVEGPGIVPDIAVIQDPAQERIGGDPQLDSAIEVILARMAAQPKVIPPVPAYPDLSLKAWRELHPVGSLP